MMQLLKKTTFNFIGYRKVAIGFSLVLALITIISLIAHRGPNFSIDFAGGTLVHLKFDQSVHGDLSKVRSVVSALGFGQPEVKTIGPADNNELQVTVTKQAEGSTVADEIRAALNRDYPQNKFEVLRVEKVGPKIGGELKRDAMVAAILSLIAVLIYVGARFHLPFGVAAIIPLFHDVLITIGVFSVLDLEFSMSFVAALLTIIGYSLNDTIVIFDRIRENMHGGLRGRSFIDLVNASINQTLSRTLITSLTTLFVVASLYILGSEAIKDFALALVVGVVAGSYSTIYIASPILIWWHNRWPVVK